MSALPPELAPWAEVLAGLAPDLVEGVGRMARRLDLLLGRVRVRPRPRGDDPEGYDGLDRRGPYDRLLLSEWALADEVPEEFDRRAVSGEHAFLRLDRRDRSRGARTLVLFDGGPDNLGGPRVVQLAALIVLWRRALASRADLLWGMLQGGALATTVDRATIQGFLGGRTARAATEADLARARDGAGDLDELWLIGAPAALVGRAGSTTLRLALTDVIEPDVHAIDARLSRGGTRLGEARLDLPAAHLCARLLTDPFPAPPAARAEPSPRRKPTKPAPDTSPEWKPFPRGYRGPWHLRFLPGTSQLVVCMADDWVLLWAFEGGKLKSPKPKIHELPAEPLLAIGRAKQQTLAVTLTPDGKARTWFGSPLAAPPFASPDTTTPGLVVTAGALTAFTHGDQLFVVPATDREKLLKLDGNVYALFRYYTDLLAVGWTNGDSRLQRILPNGTVEPIARLPGRLAWVGGGRYYPEQLGAILTRPTDRTPRAFRIQAGTRLGLVETRARPDTLDPEEVVIGVAFEGSDAAAITYDRHKNTIRHGGTGTTVSPARAPLQLTVSPDGTVAAWRTSENFVEAWSLVDGEPLLLRYCG